MSLHYVDRDGKSLTLWEWAALAEDETYRTIARENVHGWIVETVWRGVVSPTPFFDVGTFETMAFPPGVSPGVRERLPFGGGLYCLRRASEPAALAAHDYALMMVREAMGPRMITAGDGR